MSNERKSYSLDYAGRQPCLPLGPGSNELPLPPPDDASESLVAYARRVALLRVDERSASVLSELLALETIVRRKGGRK